MRALMLAALMATGMSALAQTSWTRYPGNPVVTVGGPGSWDGGQAFFQTVIYHDSTYMMWYGGSASLLLSEPFRTGRATSSNGITWEKDSLNPVLNLGPPGAWDDFAVWIPAVLFDGIRYRMWYLGASGCFLCNVSHGYATSMDGRRWQKDSLNPIISEYGPPRSSVLFDGSTYKFWYESTDGIRYATSIDGIHWTPYPQNPVLTPGPPGSWDATAWGLGVSVLHDSIYYHMWYAVSKDSIDFINLVTAGIGYAVSKDGINWKKYPGNPVLTGGETGSWDQNVFSPSVLREGPLFKMWYSADNPQSVNIGYATAPRSPATIFINRSAIDFHNVAAGTVSDTLHEVISNWGFTPLTISSISHQHSEFVLSGASSLPVTIPPFEEIDVAMVFRPTQAGVTVTDSIVIASNDSLHPISTIALRGRGKGAIVPAHPQVLYTIRAAELYSIDRLHGSATPLAGFSPAPPQLQSLTVRRSDNDLYGVYSTPAGSTVYRLSSENGDLDSVGQIPIGDVTAIAFSPTDTLYIADAHKNLFRMSGISGTPALVDSTALTISGLAFSPGTGQLWGSAHDTVFTVNTATGALSIVGSALAGIGHSSIAFSPLGTLYGLYDNSIVVIDHASGRATVIGPTEVGTLQSIAMRNDPSAANVAASTELPRETKLYQNYPNPFNPATLIRYTISGSMENGVGSKDAKMVVYDLLGREVATLVNERKAPGNYEVQFDGTQLASGIYIYRLTAGKFFQTRKMVLMK